MAASNELAVHVDGLTKVFGSFTAVDHISFDVQRGEIFGFLGPNGSGKTTTIRMLLGLIVPSAGRASVLGHDVAREPAAIRRKVGYTSQRFSLYPDLTVMENLTFYGRAYGVWGQHLDARRQAVMHDMDLKGFDRSLASTLPGGIKQRLALAVALIHEPAILFLDEPTAGVDPVNRSVFWSLLYHLADGGTTIFVTTHYMDEAEQCNRLAFIHRGKIVAQGTPGQIRHEYMSGQILELDCDAPGRALPFLRNLPICKEVELYGSAIHIVVDDAAQADPLLREALEAEGIAVQGLSVMAPSLEDVFIARIK